MQLHGSIVALVTPMLATGEIDFEAFDRLIDWHLVSGTQGLVILGTTGESPTVSSDEAEVLFKRAVERVNKKIPVIAGVGTNCTKSTVQKAQMAERCGVDAFLIVTPYYNKPPQAGLIAHYKAVHDATKTPIILYNVPGRTGCDLAVETIAELSQWPRIVAVKDAHSDLSRVKKLRESCAEGFVLLSGEDGTALQFVRAGGDGVISVTANVVPQQMAEVYRLLQAGEVDKALKLDQSLSELHKVLFIESNPIPTKWALAKMGKISGGLRLPLVSLSALSQQRVEAVLKDFGAI